MKLPDSILNVLESQKGTITSQDICALGITRSMLGKYVKAGLLERTGRGVYTRPDSLADDIFALARRSGKIVFSHATALFLLGKSERTPFNHYATIKSCDTIPYTLRREIKVFYVKDELYDLGKIMVPTPFGNMVPCYDLERTVCDFVKNRSRMDEELLIATIRSYVGDRNRNLSKIGEYAQKLGIEEKLNRMLEVVL